MPLNTSLAFPPCLPNFDMPPAPPFVASSNIEDAKATENDQPRNSHSGAAEEKTGHCDNGDGGTENDNRNDPVRHQAEV